MFSEVYLLKFLGNLSLILWEQVWYYEKQTLLGWWSWQILLFCSMCISDIQVRLASGPNPDEGRVEIYWNNTWGNIYSSVWAYEYAKIICQQLNYKYTLSAVQEGYYKGDDVPGHTRDVYCLGNETKLAECQITFWPSNANHRDSPRGVRCSNYEPSQGIVRYYHVTVKLCGLFIFKISCWLCHKRVWLIYYSKEGFFF